MRLKILTHLLNGNWKDDWTSRLKRTEARWPWRLEILRLVREYQPRFPQKTFDKRWSLVESALERLHDADAAPHPAEAVATMILGMDTGACLRVARRYFGEYAWWFEDWC